MGVLKGWSRRETKSVSMVRTLFNLGVTILILFILETVGWVTIKSPGKGEHAHFFEVLVVAGLMFVIGEILEVFYSGLLRISLGVALAIVPLYYLACGLLRLKAARALFPDWFSYDHHDSLINLLIMCLLLGACRWHLTRPPGPRQASDGSVIYVSEDEVRKWGHR